MDLDAPRSSPKVGLQRGITAKIKDGMPAEILDKMTEIFKTYKPQKNGWIEATRLEGVVLGRLQAPQDLLQQLAPRATEV